MLRWEGHAVIVWGGEDQWVLRVTSQCLDLPQSRPDVITWDILGRFPPPVGDGLITTVNPVARRLDAPDEDLMAAARMAAEFHGLRLTSLKVERK